VYPLPARYTEGLGTHSQLGPGKSGALLALFAALLIVSHAPLLRLPYFWDEAGYYIPAARDLLAGALIPHSTPSNAHPPLVLAWIALLWKFFGQSALVTRSAMLLLAAFSLLGFFRMARTVSNSTVAACSTFLVAIYPVFFAQSSLAQVDLPAAGLIFWGLDSHYRGRRMSSVTWFSLAALAKETAILVPFALLLWYLLGPFIRKLLPTIIPSLAMREESPITNRKSTLDRGSSREAAAFESPARQCRENEMGSESRKGRHIDLPRPPSAVEAAHERAFVGTSGTRPLPGRSKGILSSALFSSGMLLIIPVIPLALWYAYHYLRTGYVFGNPEFFRYNVQATLHPLRIFLALLLRLWQMIGYLDLYVLTLACVVAMTFAPIKEQTHERSRIDLPVQLSFLAIAIVYLVSLSVIGGAVLARYMLPVVPLMILVCVSTIWRRLPAWKAVIVVVALAFISALFVNPPYGFSPEDNLAYRDYIRLHQRAETFLQARYPNARVLTAWPASDEMTHPYLGYVRRPMQVVRIDDFSAEQVLSSADIHSRFDVALIFSTKYQPQSSIFDRWRKWQEWKSRYFGYHVDLTPEAAAPILGGSVVYVERRRGQWVGIVEVAKFEEARLRTLVVSRQR
jgi:4-amino-4-deoxy-L-arabinose transferase-like glycosyltransferase